MGMTWNDPSATISLSWRRNNQRMWNLAALVSSHMVSSATPVNGGFVYQLVEGKCRSGTLNAVDLGRLYRE